VYRSANNGACWSSRNSGLPAGLSERAIAYDALHPNVWFAGVRQGGVYLSTDAGGSWVPLLSGLGSLNVNALAVDASHATVYAGTETGTYQFTSYPTSSMAVGPGAASLPSLSVSPNPFRESVEIRMAGGPSGRVSLEIFDPGGRRMRRLLRGAMMTGGASVSWDGRDDRGTRVPDGVYLARWSAEGSPPSWTSRLVLVR